jgi:hypothetical protein
MLNDQSMVVLALAAALTFVGVSGFLTEKKSGALELLLVTPISVHQIIFGRVWGLWKQFFPAALTLLLLWLGAESLVSASYGPQVWRGSMPSQNTDLVWRLLTAPIRWGLSIAPIQWSGPPVNPYELQYLNEFHRTIFDALSDSKLKGFTVALGFLALPVFATYFALRVKNLVVGAALTWLALLLCPLFAFLALGTLAILFDPALPSWSLYAALLLANLAFALLACFLLRHSLSRRIYSF